jgi:hypothetical protein
MKLDPDYPIKELVEEWGAVCNQFENLDWQMDCDAHKEETMQACVEITVLEKRLFALKKVLFDLINQEN